MKLRINTRNIIIPHFPNNYLKIKVQKMNLTNLLINQIIDNKLNNIHNSQCDKSLYHIYQFSHNIMKNAKKYKINILFIYIMQFIHNKFMNCLLLFRKKFLKLVM